MAKGTITNADRIRTMTDEELADFLGNIIHDWGQGDAEVRFGNSDFRVENWLDWLNNGESQITSALT